MKILLTGATGYIGKRLLPILVDQGHHVVCCVRDRTRFNPKESLQTNVSVIEIDLLEEETLSRIPKDIDAAYYLVHSMSDADDYASLELKSARHFRKAVSRTEVEQVIYLSGIINESNLSEHLRSRKNVEEELAKGSYFFSCFRAGIIVGSGSASFEIIRDLVEKLPIMVAPKWLMTKCQPIGITDVLTILTKALGKEETYNANYDIGCYDILSYRDMLLEYARVRNLKRRIFIIPVLTPRLSSYWLYFVTSTSYLLARSLVDSMKVEVICRNMKIMEILDVEPISYTEALRRAFDKIQNNEIISSWKDSYASSGSEIDISEFITVPEYGVFKDTRQRKIKNPKATKEKIWRIGGKNGWYYGNFLWRLRGLLDKMVGGVGLRRGRTSPTKISAGDALDFWRVLYANEKEGRLLLFAEMKLPGEAWLEFKVNKEELIQTATFRPRGLLGRIYWYSVLPFHGFIFRGMIDQLVREQEK